MNQAPALIVTDEELNAIFNAPGALNACCPKAQSAWVASMASGAAGTMTDEALCELATERHPDGPLAAINALLEGLALRHADDSATLAALMAVQHFHLPNLLGDRDAELRDALMRP